LVSDGSYHPIKHQGTAAWILEGTKSSIQIIGRVVTPGHDTTQSAYRSELAGILATITVLNTLLSFHKITSTLTLRCDCETGIHKAFDLRHKPTLQDSSYDLLQAIHYELSHTNITWQYMHIKGHMDDTINYNDLDRPSQLNVIVDYIAKAFLHNPTVVPNHQQVHSPAWSLLIHETPLLTDIDQSLYNLVHTPTAKQYWKKNHVSLTIVLTPSTGKVLRKHLKKCHYHADFFVASTLQVCAEWASSKKFGRLVRQMNARIVGCQKTVFMSGNVRLGQFLQYGPNLLRL
jgi:hypothetical protein